MSFRKSRSNSGNNISLFSLFLKAALIILFSINSAAAAPSQEAIRIGGTGGVLEVMRLLARDFQRKHPDAAITVFPSMGSNGGIRALLAGALDIGLSARLLNDSERGATAHAFARTPFVFAVAKNNPVTGFKMNEIVDIYAGKTATWPDSMALRLVLRPLSEYDTTLLKSMSGEMERAVQNALSRNGMIIEITDQDSARTLERVPGALGTITIGQMISEKRLLKALSLNGVTPGEKTVADGTYSFFKTYYLISKPDMQPLVREFIDFIYSAAGRELLTRSGYSATGR